MVRDDQRAERITMITDLLLATVAGVLSIRLLTGARGGEWGVVAWGLAFLFTAAAAAAGGVFHGFRYHLTQATAGRLWGATLFLAAVVAFCLAAAAAFALPSPRLRTVLLWIALTKLVTVIQVLRRSPTFTVIAVDSGLSLLVVGAAAIWGLADGRLPEAGWMLGGVVLSLAGAAVQGSRWRSDRNFDHNDLFHLAQIAACLLFYQSAGRG